MISLLIFILAEINYIYKVRLFSHLRSLLINFQDTYLCQQLLMFAKTLYMKLFYTIIFTAITFHLFAQNAVINEVDSDTDGVDDKEFIEIKTVNPFTSLDGYMIVLFNGSDSGGDASYFNLELDGFATDINGLFVLGGPEVSPIADFELPLNTIQNGADAVGLYLADENDMPIGTVATTMNLVDAVVYDTNDSDDTVLMNLLGQSQQYNEGENGDKDFQSVQRANDGTWYVADATPKQLNDGSGVILNGISISKDQDVYNEGDTMIITLTTEQAVQNNVSLDIDITNGSFTTADFTGSTTLVLQQGSTTAQTSINLIEDGIEEGDEFSSINILNLPPEFISNNNNVSAVIIDSDFTVSNFGTPLNPTYGNVSNEMPDGYYDNIDGLAGSALIQGIQDLISEEGTVRAHTYEDVKTILEQADQNPQNSNEIWMIYSEAPRGKYLYQTGSSGTGKWNREHTYPRSRGDFFSIEEDDIPTGINQWWNTNADSLRHANSDAHGLRAADALENSQRGNQHYGEYDGPTGNAGSFKGDVARSVLFLSVRYNGLDVVNGFPDVTGQLGDLATLLTWHQQDPPDDYEMNRNNIIYDWQKNRNPFIDYPDLVDYIWGNEFGNVWNEPLSVNENSLSEMSVFPNPVDNKVLNISNSKNKALDIELYDIQGKKIRQMLGTSKTQFFLDVEPGIYIIKISDGKDFKVLKMLFQ
jgi:hypothetical protein